MEQFTFKGQKTEEDVLIASRKHPWTLARPAIRIFVVSLTVIAVIFIFQASWISSYALMGYFLWLAFYGGYHYLVWRHDYYIITDLRVLDLNQKSFFHRRMRYINLDQIRDVSYVSRGLGALLSFGTLIVHLYKSREKMVLEYVENPENFQGKILDLLNK